MCSAMSQLCCQRSAKGRTGPHACACQWATWERQARRACAARSCARASLEEKLRESDVVGLASWVTSLGWRQHSPTWHSQLCACELRRAGDRTGCCAMWCPQPFDDETRCPLSVCRVHRPGCTCAAACLRHVVRLGSHVRENPTVGGQHAGGPCHA